MQTVIEDHLASSVEQAPRARGQSAIHPDLRSQPASQAGPASQPSSQPGIPIHQDLVAQNQKNPKKPKK